MIVCNRVNTYDGETKALHKRYNVLLLLLHLHLHLYVNLYTLCVFNTLRDEEAIKVRNTVREALKVQFAVVTR